MHVTRKWSLPEVTYIEPTVALLSTLWIGGFDLVYICVFDKQNGIN